MAGDDDAVVIVCSELSLVQLGLLRGNRAEDCSFCGRGVVLSTEGQLFQAARVAIGETVKLCCPHCAVERDDDTRVMGAVPGAIERAKREGYRVSRATERAARKGKLKPKDVFPDLK